MALFTKKGNRSQAGSTSLLIQEIIRACCNEGTQAVVLWPDLKVISTGSFADVDEESLALADPTDIRTSLLDPSLPIIVTFTHLGRVFSFVTWFVLYTPQAVDKETDEITPAWLVLKMPRRMAAADSRASAWIKVLADSSFRVEMTAGGMEALPVQATRLSLTGINLRLQQDGPKLAKEAKAILKMGMEEEQEQEKGEEERGEEAPIKKIWKTLKVEAQVRKCEPPEYDFYFPCSLTAEGIKPPEPLRQLVKEVEQEYLQKRAEMEMEEK